MSALQLAGAERQHRAEEQPRVPSINLHGRQWLCCLPLLSPGHPWDSGHGSPGRSGSGQDMPLLLLKSPRLPSAAVPASRQRAKVI